MKKIFGKILLLITAVCMVFSFAACSSNPPPAPKEYTQEEVIATAVENTLKEKDIKIRADADAYIAQLDKVVPTTVAIDVKNQNGKIDFAASYTATTTVANQSVTIGNSYTYKDGILYAPAYDENGDIYSDRVSTSIVDVSFEELLTPDASGATPLSQVLAMLAEQGDEVVKPQNGVYTFEAETDAKLALTVLKAFVLSYEDTQLGEMLASLAGGGYTREALVEDLTDIFESPTVAGLANNVDTLFAHIGLDLTMKDIVNALLDEMGYTKNDIYNLIVQMIGSAQGIPKPTAQQTAYDYAMLFVGALDISLLEDQLGFSMADIQTLVIDGYVDKDDCFFGDLWDVAVGYLDNAIIELSMLFGIDAQIEPPFLSCANLAKYTVNSCKGSVKLVVDANTMRISELAFTVDNDIDFNQENIKTYIDFDGTVTYGEPVTVTVPDKFIMPCIEYDEIGYDMLEEGAPWWYTDLTIRVFVGDCTETGSSVTVYNESGECDYEVTLQDGVLYVPAALLDDAYDNDTNYIIEIVLPSGDDSAYVLWVIVNPKGGELAWIGIQAA